jgi:hypothetical protein
LLFFSLLLTETALAAFIEVEPTQGPAGASVTVKGIEFQKRSDTAAKMRAGGAALIFFP